MKYTTLKLLLFELFPRALRTNKGFLSLLKKAYVTYRMRGWRGLNYAIIYGNYRHTDQRLNTLATHPTTDHNESPPSLTDHIKEISRNTSGDTSDYVPFIEHASFNSGMRLIAFYLPQFHPIPENDEWWGRGFTEWTNVSKALPQFLGHYQPRLPGELGFYDLRILEVQKRQIELAKNYGVYGFCYHHYWFAGKRLLDLPFKQVLEHPELDFPFCLCWANENWTRTWDGLDKEILIAQAHSPDDDLAFIHEITPALRDKRYIKINNRPLLVVYRASLLPDAAETAVRWRRHCKDAGIGEIYLALVQCFEVTDPTPFGFDAAIEFPPHKVAVEAPPINHKLQIVNPDYGGHVIDYSYLVEQSSQIKKPNYPLYRGVFPSWDNEARRPGRGYTVAGSSPVLYQEWLSRAISYCQRHNSESDRLIFINAWNEWGEAAYLEPDRRYGYAYLEATFQALKQSTINSSRPILSSCGRKEVD